MKGNKTLALLLTMLLVALTLGGCTATEAPAASPEATSTPESSTTEEDGAAAPVEDGPYTKYDPGITLTMIRSVDTNRAFMPGESWDNNLWTQAYQDRLGITFEYTWTCAPDEYNNKVNLAIASDELPDYFKCTYDQFFRMAKAGKLADLTPYIDSIGTEAMQAGFNANDGLLRKQVTVDGKIQALGEVKDMCGAGHMLWYRDDWAAKLGVSQPQTAEDLWAMADLFASQDPNGDGTPTVGFGVSKGLWNAGMGLEGWFALDEAYPTIWVEENGKLVFGATQEQVKVTLQKLADAYKRGVIDSDFINKGDWAEAPDDVVKNKIGMVIGPIWFGDWKCKDVMMAAGSNAATWTKMEIPAKVPVDTKLGDVWVVNAACEHPEAAIKIANLTGELLNGETAEGKYHDQKDPNGNTVDNFFHSLGYGYNVITSWNLHCANLVTEALETGDTSNLNAEQLSYYERCKIYADWKPGDDPEALAGYTSYAIFGPDGAQFVGEQTMNNGGYLLNAYYGPNTDAMNENWSNLVSKRDEIFTTIILGQVTVDEGFQQWLSFWSAMGGDQITEEVNAWYAEQ